MELDLSNLPASWRAEPLKDAADFTRKPRGLILPKTVPFVPMDMLSTTGIYATRSEARSVDELTSGTYVEDGDVMVAKITPCFENGKQGILAVGSPFAYATTEVIPLRGRPTKTDTLFLHFLLLHPGLRAKLASQMEGSTNRQRLPKAVVEKASVPVPPLDEQRQIAAVLSAVQRAIERQERLSALSAELKKALMHKLFTEGTRGERLKQTEIGPVPESWTISPVGDLCNLVSGGTPSKANPSLWSGTIPWASPKDMKLPRLADTMDHVSQAGIDEGSRLVPPGTIFVVIRGMILMRDVPIAQATVPMAFNQDMKALIGFRGVSSDFMLYSLQNARDRILNKVGSSAHGTRTLMTSAIEQLLVAVPSIADQQVISRALRSLEEKYAMHDRTRSSLQTLFRTLLHQLMTAQVRVHDRDLSALEEAAQLAGAV